MGLILCLILCFVFVACTKVDTVSIKNDFAGNSGSPEPTKTVAASPTVETRALLKPVKTDIKFNAEQQKYLNTFLPPKAREILEKAEKFEALAEVSEDAGGISFKPNRVAVVTSESEKKEILEAFYRDIPGGNANAACFLPQHGIRATYQGKTVELALCFQCSNFYGESPFGEIQGGIVRENRKSEELFNRIIKDKGIEIKE